MIDDDDNPRRGVVVGTIAEAEKLIADLRVTIAYLHTVRAERFAQMRVLMEEDTE